MLSRVIQGRIIFLRALRMLHFSAWFGFISLYCRIYDNTISKLNAQIAQFESPIEHQLERSSSRLTWSFDKMVKTVPKSMLRIIRRFVRGRTQFVPTLNRGERSLSLYAWGWSAFVRLKCSPHDCGRSPFWHTLINQIEYINIYYYTYPNLLYILLSSPGRRLSGNL